MFIIFCMDYEQQQQKGLFTFYREQADLEDELKLKRNFIKEGKSQKLQDREKKLPSSSQHSLKNDHHHHKKTIPPSLSEHIEKRKEEGSRSVESKDKIIEILRNYDKKQTKKRDHLRVIMQSQEENRNEQAQKLKNRLEKLLDGDQSLYFKLMMAEKSINQGQKKQQAHTSRQQELFKVNPFQKLAIIPTNYVNDFQYKDSKQPYLKKSMKSCGNSVQIRKNDKIETTQSKDRYVNISRQLLPSNSYKLNLPKIESRTNSEVIAKTNRMKLSKILEKSQIEPLKSQRANYHSELSLFLDSVKINRNSPSTKLHTQNKIYSLFIENKELKRKQQSKFNEKQIVLSDVLKKLKYS